MSACKMHGCQWVLLCIGMQLMAAGCGEEQQQAGRGMSGATPAPAKAAAAAAKGSETLVLKDEDFVESERNRDPFRAYTAPAKHGLEASADSQRFVIMPDTAVESMRLIAIISGLARAKAMLTDEKGVGYVVQRGDYIGKPKVFQSTGSVAMTLNWRVDRIRENEVVLTRQDPSDPGRPPLSRIIAMREDIAARM
jgi:type IV pilus assembly protein PilP